MIKVIFVCFANTCRSVAFESIFTSLIQKENLQDKISCISRGLSKDIKGEPVDGNMLEYLNQRGYHSENASKTLKVEELTDANFIIAVSNDLTLFLRGMLSNDKDKKKVHIATDFVEKYKGQCIKDPYSMGFDQCLNMIEDCSIGILDHIKKNL